MGYISLLFIKLIGLNCFRNSYWFLVLSFGNSQIFSKKFSCLRVLFLFSFLYLTCWAVALTCYISHSAKHRKMADFDPSGSENSWSDFDETWHSWLRPGPHPTWQLWWGSATWVICENMWLVTSLSFLIQVFSCIYVCAVDKLGCGFASHER